MSRTNHRQILMKRNHLAQITLGVRKHVAISRVQLAKVTSLSLACVCSIVDELLAEGVLIETGTVVGQRGRPKQLLQINPDGPPVAGVWLSREIVETVIANAEGQILTQRTLAYDPCDDSPEIFVNVAASELRRCAEAAGKDVSALKGIGLALSDMIDPDQGIIDSMGGWNGVPIVRLLSDRMGVPVFADNDIRASALTSIWLGDDARSGGAIYITVSKGVGFAFVNNHDLLRGAHNIAGQFGHVTVDRNGPQCKCGNRGCTAAMVSDHAFVGNVWPDLREHASAIPAQECAELVGKALNMATSGDLKARAALATVAECLGISIANTINLFDPRVVYIGGTLINLEPDLVLDMIRSEALKHIWVKARGVEIRAIPDCRPFLLKGSIGLVLLEPYRRLQEDNLSARLVKSSARIS